MFYGLDSLNSMSSNNCFTCPSLGKGIPMDPSDANHVSKKEFKSKELVIDIPPDLEPAEWPECCIYRVQRNCAK